MNKKIKQNHVHEYKNQKKKPCAKQGWCVYVLVAKEKMIGYGPDFRPDSTGDAFFKKRDENANALFD